MGVVFFLFLGLAYERYSYDWDAVLVQLPRSLCTFMHAFQISALCTCIFSLFDNMLLITQYLRKWLQERFDIYRFPPHMESTLGLISYLFNKFTWRICDIKYVYNITTLRNQIIFNVFLYTARRSRCVNRQFNIHRDIEMSKICFLLTQLWLITTVE